MLAPSVNSVRVARLASEEFVLDYTRNQDSFALPAYSQAVPVDKRSDLYLRLDTNTASRVLGDEGQDFDWPVGADAPDGDWNLDEFSWESYRTRRKAFPFRIPTDTADEAEWDIVNQNTRSKAQQGMTSRSLRAITLLTTEANFGANKTTAWTPKWDAGTVADPKLLKGLLEMYQGIHVATQGSVSPADIVVVFNPADARKIAATAEIREYVKHLDVSKINQAFFSGNPAFVNNAGLPLEYGGFTLRVEDTVRNTAKKGATPVKGYAWQSGKAVMLCRPNGPGGGPEGNAQERVRLATVTVFEKENMTVELFDGDSDAQFHRRLRGRIVDDVDVVLTSPASAWYASGFMT